MDREGLSKIRRAELLVRLDALDSQIESQARRAKYVSDLGWNTVLSEQRLMRFATRVSSTSRRLSTSWARTHWRPGRRRTARQTASLNDCRSLPPRNRLAWRDPEAMEFFISGLTLAAGESGRSAASRTCRCIT